MDTVTLKNGSEEFGPAVIAIHLSLTRVFNEDPMAAYDLVMKCRDSNYRMFGNAEERLANLSLMQPGGHIHDTVRNVVLSSVSGTAMRGIGAGIEGENLREAFVRGDFT